MSKIEWTDETWNPVIGCSKVSPGCKHCYAMRDAHHRLRNHPNPKVSGPYQGLTRQTAEGPTWTGVVRTMPARLTQPLRWRRPRRIFVNSMSDLFHERVTADFIAACFGVMAASRAHTFQVLTKRPERARDWMRDLAWRDGLPVYRCLDEAYGALPEDERKRRARQFSDLIADEHPWPLPNVWLGVSVESAAQVHRIDELRQIPAAVRFLSLEPLLGPLPNLDLAGIHWVIVGDESGPRRRPGRLEWVRDIRDACVAQGVPFFFKQWHDGSRKVSLPALDGRQWEEMPADDSPRCSTS